MAINSRAKGKSGELDFCLRINDLLGIRLIRNLEQSRNGGHDLIVHRNDLSNPVAAELDNYAIEVKRHSTATPSDILCWWSQTVSQSRAVEKYPALAVRLDRRPWVVYVPMCCINCNMTYSLSFDYACGLSIEGFCAIIREHGNAGHRDDQSNQAA